MESIFFVVLTEFFSMNMAYLSKLIKKKDVWPGRRGKWGITLHLVKLKTPRLLCI